MHRIFAPWRRAHVEGREKKAPPSPTGCIFCDYPRPPGDHREDADAYDAERLVVTAREHGFVILNRYPYGAGHVMVVPRSHTQHLESLDDEAFLSTTRLLKDTIAAVRKAYEPDGMNIGMNMGKAGGAGIDEHVHWHVLPRWSGDMNFMPALMDTKVVNEALWDTYEKLAGLLRTGDEGGAP